MNNTIGFTGSRRGLSASQTRELEKMLIDTKATHFAHGCCIGSDVGFHWLVRNVKHDAKIKGYRATTVSQQDTLVVANCDELFEHILPPLQRNRHLIHGVAELWAAPSGPEVLRSGTWATIRHAKGRIPIVIVYPNGKKELWSYGPTARTVEV